MMPDSPTCATCRFYEPAPTRMQEVRPGQGNRVVNVDAWPGRTRYSAVEWTRRCRKLSHPWPERFPDEWCGEHQPAASPPDR